MEREHKHVFDEVLRAGYDGIECRSALLAQHEEQWLHYISTNAFSIIAVHANPKSFAVNDREQVLDDLLKRMNRLGCKYLIFSMGRSPDYRNWFDMAAQISERCARANVQFCYHNHAGEFDNDSFFDELTREVNKL